jgi:hypothetical protein
MAEDNVLEKKEMKLDGSRVSSVYYKYIPSTHELQSKFMLEKLKCENHHSQKMESKKSVY